METKMIDRQKSQPIQVAKTIRPTPHMHISTAMPGKMVPLIASPVLREDKVVRAEMTIAVDQMETVEVIANPVNVTVSAYLVPNSAFDRFDSIDQLNRAHEGIEPYAGQSVVDYFTTVSSGSYGSNEIFKYLGRHTPESTQVNDAYIQAYNEIWNLRAGRRSPNITKRSVTEATLAPAFWAHEQFRHIVPDFDQQDIDGEIALNVAAARIPVRGIGKGNGTFTQTDEAVRETDGDGTVTYSSASNVSDNSTNNRYFVEEDPNNSGFPNIYAELQDNGITLSLSNIDVAKKTKAFAAMRKQYEDHDDEWIIDMLMNGLSIPNPAFMKPMLLGQVTSKIGQSKRYATDAGNLTKSVADGSTVLQLRYRTPVIPTGGVVMVVAEITPAQMFERQFDPYLMATDVEDLPSYLRDFLDPEPVDIVQNVQIDTEHTSGSSTFGYEPKNRKWATQAPTVGGDFFRPQANTFVEKRQRLWISEPVDPVLSEDFYIVSDLSEDIFAQSVKDNYEVNVQGLTQFQGNTYFGPTLIESSDNYEKILAEVPFETIDKNA